MLRLHFVLYASLTLVCALAVSYPARGADPKATKEVAPPGIHTFYAMPKSAPEVAAAHLKAATQSVEFLPKGEPLEITSFSGMLTKRDRFEKFAKTPNPSTRRAIFTVGIEVAKEDRARLPQLSSALILDYLNDHYVSVQARIQKDARTGALYLHQRPILATGTFGTVKLTDDFTPAVSNSVREIHSLGLYLPLKTPPTPENLRTLVLVHKHTALESNSNRIEPQYEYVFVRGRSNFGGGKLDLYSFTTSEERTKLHYIRPGRPPMRYSDCTIRASVYFSRYTGGDLVPADSVMRSQSVTSQANFTVADLDNYSRKTLKLPGDAFTNITEVLDAIIDGKLRPDSGDGVKTSTVSKPVIPASANK